jgi:choline dehydrogenase-like flavoprotein
VVNSTGLRSEVRPLYHSVSRDTLRVGARAWRRKPIRRTTSSPWAGSIGGLGRERLAEAGVTVALVEAGRPHRAEDFREHRRPFQLPFGNLSREVLRRTRPRQADCYACTEHNADWFANDLEEPYTTPADKPFSRQGRLRLVGGRTNVWARQSYRLGEQDLKGRSFDGEGEDWPPPTTISCPTTTWWRTTSDQGAGRGRAGAARRPVPPRCR